ITAVGNNLVRPDTPLLFTPAATATYVLALVGDGSTSSGPFTYTVVASTAPESNAALTLGTPVAATLDAGQRALFTFTTGPNRRHPGPPGPGPPAGPLPIQAGGGERLRFQAGAGATAPFHGPGAPFRPGGHPVGNGPFPCFGDFIVTLPATGTFILALSDDL